MKLNELRKVIREEVTKVVRKELVGFVQLLSESNTPKPKKKTKVVKKKKKQVVSEKSLKDMLGDFQEENFEQKKQPQQHFSKNPVLNNILNETQGHNGSPKPGHEEYPTMGGKTYDKSKMAEMLGYGDTTGQSVQNSTMTTPEGAPISNIPDPVAKAMTRNYGDLMKAIDDKKKGSPLKPS